MEVCKIMASARHKIFNIVIPVIPWISLLYFGKRDFKRYAFSGITITIFETLNHWYGHHKKWWRFYDKPRKFYRDELPFDLGIYMLLSMWFLKLSRGSFAKFVLFNAIANGIFAFFIMDLLKKFKIVGLKRLNRIQFFHYLHFKVYILYVIQHLSEKWRISKGS